MTNRKSRAEERFSPTNRFILDTPEPLSPKAHHYAFLQLNKRSAGQGPYELVICCFHCSPHHARWRNKASQHLLPTRRLQLFPRKVFQETSSGCARSASRHGRTHLKMEEVCQLLLSRESHPPVSLWDQDRLVWLRSKTDYQSAPEVRSAG